MKRKHLQSPYISVVVPVFNEEKNIPVLYNKLQQQLEDYRYEIVFVNDGSTDNSEQTIARLHQKNPRVKLINLSRNFGHQLAITCGLDTVQGDVAIIIDADLQDPPRLIGDMLKKWRLGYDVVYGIRRIRFGENRFKRYSADLFYRLINLLSPTAIPKNVGDFRLVSSRVLATLKETREYQRFLRGLVSWMGFRQTGIEYERDKRYAGESKYTMWKMIKLGLDAIVSFSFFPLRIASVFGSLTAFGALLLIVHTFLITAEGKTVKGWASTVVLILFIGCVQLFSLGIIGEYLGRIYEEVKKRPLYIVESTLGIRKKLRRPD